VGADFTAIAGLLYWNQPNAFTVLVVDIAVNGEDEAMHYDHSCDDEN
jgi:hypothetical protein